MNTRTQRVAQQAQTNVDFLMTKEGWEEMKGILTYATSKMNKSERSEFFEVMKDEDKKNQFLTYLFASTSIEAALIQQQ
jgi:hypothetical protein